MPNFIRYIATDILPDIAQDIIPDITSNIITDINKVFTPNFLTDNKDIIPNPLFDIHLMLLD
jgi:hypothetical protein